MVVHSLSVLQIFPLLLLFASRGEARLFFADLSAEYYHLLMAWIAGFGQALSLLPTRPWQKWSLSALLAALLLLTTNALYLSPGLGILGLLLAAFSFADLWAPGRYRLWVAQGAQQAFLQSLVLFTVVFLILAPARVSDVQLWLFASVLASFSVLSFAFFCRDSWQRWRWVLLLLPVVALGSLHGQAYANSHVLLLWLQRLSIFVLYGTAVYLYWHKSQTSSAEPWYDRIIARPEIVVLLYFFGLAVLGAVLLQLPLMRPQSSDSAHAFIDGFFTAMSAISVTGLGVLDTQQDFNFWGQLMILLLIQLGGLGITSLSAWVLALLRSGRLHLAHEEALYQMSGQTRHLDTRSLVKKIFSYFLVFETVGALLLWPQFLLAGDSLWQGLWRAVFTSVSAFCNAGFSLQSDSLVAYANAPLLLLILSVLIIAGGFAPLLVLGLPQKIRTRRLGLQEKLVFSMTGALLFVGFALVLLVEWRHGLAGLGFGEKIVHAFFHSVTLRTAGFNALELASMQDISHVFSMFLMFIGGNPGSAAGGVKTITLAVLLVAAYAGLTERDSAQIFYRRIPVKIVFRSMLVILLGLAVHFVVFFFLSMTQNIPSLALLFESFSALGTVGLSLGATTQLDEVGKWIVIFAMLAGRVGPMTFVLLLMRRKKARAWQVPSEDVSIT